MVSMFFEGRWLDASWSPLIAVGRRGKETKRSLLYGPVVRILPVQEAWISISVRGTKMQRQDVRHSHRKRIKEKKRNEESH